MPKIEIIDRQLLGNVRVRSRPGVSDYILLIFLSAFLLMASTWVLNHLLEALKTESDFIRSLLDDSFGGIVTELILAIGIGTLTQFGIGIVAGQFIRKQTASGLIVTSIVVGIGGALTTLIGLLVFPPVVVGLSFAAASILGGIAAFFGYLYGFALLRQGEDWLDEHGYLFGIQNRYFCYLIPGYWLLAVSTSGIVIWTIFSFIRASAWSVLDVIPFLLGYGVLYGFVKAMFKAHTLVAWNNLYPLSRKRRVLHVLLSILLSVGLPLGLFGVFVGSGFIASNQQADYQQVVGYGDQREALKKSILAIYESRDISNELVGVTGKQERLSLEASLHQKIEEGLSESEKVSDEYLDKIHPELREAYREGLIAGAREYLEGLKAESPSAQIYGVSQEKKWDDFRSKYEDALGGELFGAD